MIAVFGLAGAALAANWAGADPSSNYSAGPMPSSCSSAPTSASCVDAAVGYLDQARANLGEGRYLLPSNFDSLTPAEQGFVLANLDRVLYGLPAMTGMTADLNKDASNAVKNDTDPQPSAQNFLSWTGNWASGYPNMALAYGGWMYDDGMESGNINCTPTDTSGCWGHRHDVLWVFDNSGPLAMGAAAANDSGGTAGYSMLLFEGDPTYISPYVYTWAQAVAAGANGGSLGPLPTPFDSSSPGSSSNSAPTATAASASRPRVISVRVHGHRITLVAIAPAGGHLQCALSRHLAHRWSKAHFHRCAATATFHVKRRGRYRLQVRSGKAVATRFLRV